MKFSIYTLGCKVNTYESNVIKDILLNHHFIEAKDEDDISDIYIINTCTVTNTAHQKSLKMIRHAIRKNKDAIIIIVGCDSQINSNLIKDIKGVSIILGNKNKSKIVDYIEEYKKNKKVIVDIYNLDLEPFETMKLNNFDKTRAFVKIEDGCENFCSYCIIPYTRGKVRSKDIFDVLDEVKSLVSNGHREIVLTGIHTGHYGSDKTYNFAHLLKELIKIDSLERIRISSIEINEITDEVLEVLKNSSKIANHLHIPIQSGCDKTLKDMNRKYDTTFFKEKIESIRKIRPDISITTDLIVGFPGESEEDFLDTIKTLRDINFSKIHVFPFSLRAKTKAESLPNHVSEQVKKERVKKVLALSKTLELSYMAKFLNQTMSFIPEVYKNGYLIGHTSNYLLVKCMGDECLLKKSVDITIDSINYPYVLAKINDLVLR